MLKWVKTCLLGTNFDKIVEIVNNLLENDDKIEKIMKD